MIRYDSWSKTKRFCVYVCVLSWFCVVMMCFGVLFQIANPMVAECVIRSTRRPLLDAHNR